MHKSEHSKEIKEFKEMHKHELEDETYRAANKKDMVIRTVEEHKVLCLPTQ